MTDSTTNYVERLEKARMRRHRHKEYGDWIESWIFDGRFSMKIWERGARVKLKGRDSIAFTIVDPEGFAYHVREATHDPSVTLEELYEQINNEATK